MTDAASQLQSSQAAINLIVAEEVGSQNLYQAKYQHPEWPGGASGVTIGIGYDCGYASPQTIAGDWGDQLSAPMVKCLQDVAGIHGSPASSYAHMLRGAVTVPWDAAMAVFQKRDMPKWENIVRQALSNTDKLSGDSFGALVSLSYNRGASFNTLGDRYNEMRAIRQLMALQHFSDIPEEFRNMKRLWPNMVGLRNRRDHEANLFEKGLAA